MSFLGAGGPGALPFLQRRCNGDTWQSPGVQYGVGMLPATENGQCTAEPPLLPCPVTLPALMNAVAVLRFLCVIDLFACFFSLSCMCMHVVLL